MKRITTDINLNRYIKKQNISENIRPHEEAKFSGSLWRFM